MSVNLARFKIIPVLIAVILGVSTRYAKPDEPPVRRVVVQDALQPEQLSVFLSWPPQPVKEEVAQVEKIGSNPRSPILSKYDKLVGLVESIQEYAEQQGDFLKLGSDTLRQYIEWIEHYTMDKNIDTLWVLAMIWQESRFNAAAVSSHGAIGLMQIMPGTGAAMGYTPDQLQDAEMNIAAGILYLYSLLQKYENLRMAIIAYNQGPGNIQRGTYNTRYYEDVLRHHTRLSSKGR